MPLKDLRGKSIYDLDREDFEKLFCQRCREYQTCDRDPKTINICMALIESGIWDREFRNPTDR